MCVLKLRKFAQLFLGDRVQIIWHFVKFDPSFLHVSTVGYWLGNKGGKFCFLFNNLLYVNNLVFQIKDRVLSSSFYCSLRGYFFSDFLDVAMLSSLSLLLMPLLLFLMDACSVLDFETRFYLIVIFSGVNRISYLGSCLQAEQVSPILEQVLYRIETPLQHIIILDYSSIHQQRLSLPLPASNHIKQFIMEKESVADAVQLETASIDTPQKLSNQVFSGYLKWTTITMFSASLISIVMFVLLNATYSTTESLSGYSPLSRLFLKTTLLAIYETVQQCDDITPGYWCSYPIDSIEYFVFKPSNGKFTNTRDVNRLIANHTTQTQICYFFNTFKIQIGNVQYNAREIKVFCYALDGFIMSIAFVLLIVNQYRAEEKHKNKKRNMIDKYTVKINNLPHLPRDQLLCKLRSYLQKEVGYYLEQHPIAKYKFSVFDIATNLELGSQQGSKISLMDGFLNLGICHCIFKRDKSYAEVWVTFGSVSNRKLILNLFKTNLWYMRLMSCFSSSPKLFQNKAIQVQKAPNPEDIIYKNLSATSTSRLIVRLFIYLICFVLLILSTILLLFLKRLSSVIVSSLAVLITNAIAPLILTFLSKYQHHSLITNYNISNINKVAIYKFINTGLVVFLSQFKIEGLMGYFSHYFAYFTNQEYSSVTNMDWILNTGLSIVYTMILSIVLSNFKMFNPYFIYYAKLVRAKVFGKPNETPPIIEMGTVQGYELYGQIAAVMMIILSYSYLLPILYSIGFLIFFTNYLTYNFMQKYYTFPVDSFNSLTKTATSWTLLAIILHMGVIGLIEDSRIHFIISCVLSFLYLFRMFLMRLMVMIINNSLRSERMKSESKRRQRELDITNEPQFQQLLSKDQRWATRKILKTRRDEICNHIASNPRSNHEYSKQFKAILVYQRDVLKFSPIQQGLEGTIIGSLSYSN